MNVLNLNQVDLNLIQSKFDENTKFKLRHANFEFPQIKKYEIEKEKEKNLVIDFLYEFFIASEGYPFFYTISKILKHNLKFHNFSKTLMLWIKTNTSNKDFDIDITNSENILDKDKRKKTIEKITEMENGNLNQNNLEIYHLAIRAVLFPLKKYHDIEKYQEISQDIIQFGFIVNRLTKNKLERIDKAIQEKINELELDVKDFPQNHPKSIFLKSITIFKNKYIKSIQGKENELVMDYIPDSFGKVVFSILQKRKIEDKPTILSECIKEFGNIIENQDQIEINQIFYQLQRIFLFLNHILFVKEKEFIQILQLESIWTDPKINIEFLNQMKEKIHSNLICREEDFDSKEDFIFWKKKEEEKLIQMINKFSIYESEKIANENNSKKKNKKTENESIKKTIKVSLLSAKNVKIPTNNKKNKIQLFGKFEYNKLDVTTQIVDFNLNPEWKESIMFEFSVKKKVDDLIFTLWEVDQIIETENIYCIGELKLDINECKKKITKTSFYPLELNSKQRLVDPIEVEIYFDLISTNKNLIDLVYSQLVLGTNKEITLKQTPRIFPKFQPIFKELLEKAILISTNFFGMSDNSAHDPLHFQNAFSMKEEALPEELLSFFEDFCLHYSIGTHFFNITYLDILTDHIWISENIFIQINSLLQYFLSTSYNKNRGNVALNISEKKQLKETLNKLYLKSKNLIKNFTINFPQNTPKNCLKSLLLVFGSLLELSLKLDINIPIEKNTENNQLQIEEENNYNEKNQKSFIEKLIISIILEGFFENYQKVFLYKAEKATEKEAQELKNLVEQLEREYTTSQQFKEDIFTQYIKKFEFFLGIYSSSNQAIVYIKATSLILQEIFDIYKYFGSDTFSLSCQILELAINEYSKYLFNDISRYLLLTNISGFEFYCLCRKLLDFNKKIDSFKDITPEITIQNKFPLSKFYRSNLFSWVSSLKKKTIVWMEQIKENLNLQSLFEQNFGLLLVDQVGIIADLGLKFINNVSWSSEDIVFLSLKIFKIVSHLSGKIVNYFYKETSEQEYVDKIKKENSFENMCIILNTYPKIQEEKKEKVLDILMQEHNQFFRITNQICSLIQLICKFLIYLKDLYRRLRNVFENLNENENENENENSIKQALESFHNIYTQTKNNIKNQLYFIILFLANSMDREIYNLLLKLVVNHLEKSPINQPKENKRRKSIIVKEFLVRKRSTRKLFIPILCYLEYQSHIYSVRMPTNKLKKLLNYLFKILLENLKQIISPYSNLFKLETPGKMRIETINQEEKDSVIILPKNQVSFFVYLLDAFKKLFFKDSFLQIDDFTDQITEVEILIDLFKKDTNHLINLIHFQFEEKNQLIDFLKGKISLLQEIAADWVYYVIGILYGRRKDDFISQKFINELEFGNI